MKNKYFFIFFIVVIVVLTTILYYINKLYNEKQEFIIKLEKRNISIQYNVSDYYHLTKIRDTNDTTISYYNYTNITNYYIPIIEQVLNKKEIKKMKPLFLYLCKNREPEICTYNLLKWEMKNIQYDINILKENGVQVRTPSQIYNTKRGVCLDFAILTLAILLNSNYSVYFLDVTLNGGESYHAAAAINISNKIYVLDQRPPMIPLENYCKVNEKNITLIKIYRVELNNKKAHFIYLKYIKPKCNYKKPNLDLIKKELIKILSVKHNLNYDNSLRVYLLNKSLGNFQSIFIYSVTIFNYSKYIDPLVYKHYALDIYNKALNNKKLLYVMKKYHYFYINLSIENQDLKIILLLGKK